MNEGLISRFESAFGPVNAFYEDAGHLFGIINSQNIDSSRNKGLSTQTWQHMDVIKRTAAERNLPLIVFTHIPLYKPHGACTDDPLIWYDK